MYIKTFAVSLWLGVYDVLRPLSIKYYEYQRHVNQDEMQKNVIYY